MPSSTQDLSREEWAELQPAQKIADIANDHVYTVQSLEVHHGHTIIVATDESGEEFDLIHRAGFRLMPSGSTGWLGVYEHECRRNTADRGIVDESVSPGIGTFGGRE